MAFDYGKDTLGIKNPFKLEGFLELARGLLILIIGIILVFNISSDLNSGLKSTAWLKLGIALSFLSWGVYSLIRGSFYVFRFLVGRNVPGNLSNEKDDRRNKAYKPGELAEMLKKRLNFTFQEKDNFFSRFVITLIPNFLFLPPAYRAMVDGVSVAVIKSIVSVLIFLIGFFTIKTGMLDVHNANTILEWYALILSVYLLVVWYKNRPTNKKLNAIISRTVNVKAIIIPIVLAIILPVVMAKLSETSVDFIPLNISVFGSIFTLLLLGIATTFAAFFLAKTRVNETVPNTAVSEYLNELQLEQHPRDLFRFFDLEMANKRYKELPNRIYREMNPILEFEGAQNKGNFKGDTIQETQPIYREVSVSKKMEQIRFIIAVVGRLMAVLGCIIIFLNLNSFANDFSFRNYFNTFFFASILFTFQYYWVRIAHIFWGEMQFTSHLVQFTSQGTFNESKIATGMSVYDSTRSENTIMHTKSTSWIFVSEIVTTTLADVSTNNLEGYRYILEMDKDDNFLNDIVNCISGHIDKNKVLAGIHSNSDIENISNLHKFNEITRPTNPNTIGELKNNNPEKLEE